MAKYYEAEIIEPGDPEPVKTVICTSCFWGFQFSDGEHLGEMVGNHYEGSTSELDPEERYCQECGERLDDEEVIENF